jgi:hypothetical protein
MILPNESWTDPPIDGSAVSVKISGKSKWISVYQRRSAVKLLLVFSLQLGVLCGQFLSSINQVVNRLVHLATGR